MQTFRETFTHYDDAARDAFLAGHYSTHAFAHQIREGKVESWLVELAGEPVGYAQWGAYKLPMIALHERPFELHRLYIAQLFQGFGLGKLFMERALAMANQHAADALYLGVWEKNKKAQQFYARYGFAKVGEYDYPPVGDVVDREWILVKEIGNEN